MVLHKEEELQQAAPPVIAAGDLVIVYERYDAMKAVVVDPSKQFSNRFGNFNMGAWVGLPFGSKACAKPPSQGWVYLLAPTPELWTIVLRHRTQILYAADISLVCTFLELRPGCTVLESGTGSGSLTTSLARAVGLTGRVHTFEFHEQRCAAAAGEFRSNRLSGVVSIAQRDIEKDGFPAELAGQADGVFLDLPGPWNAVPSAAASLRPDGVFCSFSPCIEQVQRTCAALARNGFYALRTMECLLRNYEVRAEKLVADLDSHPSMHPVMQAGGGRGQGNQKQGQGRGNKRKRGPQSEDVNGSSAVDSPFPDAVAATGSAPSGLEAGRADAGLSGAAGVVAAKTAVQQMLVVRPSSEARGHTGYLTFARKAVQLAQEPEEPLVAEAAAAQTTI